METKRAYRFRCYPTIEQGEVLARTFGCVRFTYNYMLRLRTDSWLNHHKRVGYHETSSELTLLKKQPEFSWLNEVSSVPVQQSLRHLQTAFNNFFAKRTKYPVFKNKSGAQSATYTSNAFCWNRGKLTISKIGAIKIKFSRTVPKASKVSSVTITKDASDRYFVSILCSEDVQPKSSVSKKVGIDLGLTHFAILSTGEKVSSPKAFSTNEKKLAKLQRRLAKKQKGSANYKKAKLKVARLHAKIADTRKDFLHKLSTRLVNENQVIAVESLAVSNMQKNRYLAKSISDAGWSEFVRQLEYKSLWYGRELVGIDRWYPSSKRCSACGYTLSKMPLRLRKWVCPECGTTHDRDINAARNVLAAGLAVLALGESVNPVCM